jgi:hypothetical protein
MTRVLLVAWLLAPALLAVARDVQGIPFAASLLVAPLLLTRSLLGESPVATTPGGSRAPLAIGAVGAVIEVLGISVGSLTATMAGAVVVTAAALRERAVSLPALVLLAWCIALPTSAYLLTSPGLESAVARLAVGMLDSARVIATGPTIRVDGGVLFLDAADNGIHALWFGALAGWYLAVRRGSNLSACLGNAVIGAVLAPPLHLAVVMAAVIGASFWGLETAQQIMHVGTWPLFAAAAFVLGEVVGRRSRNGLAHGALIVSLVMIAGVTLRPGEASSATGGGWLADAACNVALFVPFGVALQRSGIRTSSIAQAAGLLAAAVELLQTGIPGRVPTLRDVAANLIGAWVGAMLARGISASFLDDPRRASRACFGAGLLASGLLALPGLLATPVATETVYFQSLAPVRANFGTFVGSIFGAQIGAVPIAEHGMVQDARKLLDALARSERMVIDLTRQQRSDRLAPLLLISSEANELLVVATQSDDIAIRRQSRATGFGLREPWHAWPDALAEQPLGSSMRIELQPFRLGYVAGINRSAPMSGRFGPTPGSFWRLWVPCEVLSESARRSLDMAAVFGVFTPIGLWWRRRSLAFFGAALTGLALAAGPALFGGFPAPGLQWIGAAVGLAFGVVAGHWLRHARARISPTQSKGALPKPVGLPSRGEEASG